MGGLRLENILVREGGACAAEYWCWFEDASAISSVSFGGNLQIGRGCSGVSRLSFFTDRKGPMDVEEVRV